MGKSVRVFISSTWKDLKPEREAVEEALHRMRDTAFAGMEYFGSRPETPKEVSQAEVDRSDVYIGIFAHRYGSGITEAEYRQARQRDIPCLVYFKDDSVPVVPAHMERDAEKVTKLEALKRELKQHHTISFFHSPDHLASQVVADLHNLLGSAPLEGREEPRQSRPEYRVNIREGRGIVIGDHAQVTQTFDHGPCRTDRDAPTDPSSGYRMDVIRELLTAALDDEQLTTLCFDHFRKVYEQFSTGMSKGQKIQRLLDYCERNLVLNDLLAQVKEHNPTQFARFESRLKQS